MIAKAKLAENLIACLELKLPPIAVSFSSVAPANIQPYDGVVPAGCVFWQEAATRTFVTSAKDHALCSIGVHTHHLTQPARTYLAELSEALKAMCDRTLTDDVAMWAFPGGKLEQYHTEIAALARANKTLTTFHMRRREDVEAGKQPTVRQHSNGFRLDSKVTARRDSP